MRRSAMAVAALVAVTALAGCGRFTKDRGLGDAPIDRTSIDSTKAQIIEMPNTFGNVATKCDGHGHRLYVTTNKHVSAVDDPGCTR